MLDLFLRLIDRLIDLKRVQGRRDAKTFESLVQPTFADLTVIHQAYLEAFTNCLNALARPETTTAEVARDLLTEATKGESMRKKIVVLARELETSCETVEMRRFFASVSEYFSRSRVRFGTHFSEAIALTDVGTKYVVERALRSTLKHIRAHWEKVCRAYGAAAQVAAKADS
jgi:hypothetical protein